MAYDERNDGTFDLRLIDITSNMIICRINLGKYFKNRRLLNLKETHDINCSLDHNIIYCHDVKCTKCVFNKEVKIVVQ